MAQPVTRYANGYSYIDLANVPLHRGVFNLFAVVTEWNAPRKTGGADLLCTMRLVDVTLVKKDQPVQTIELMCFAPNSSQLPQVRRPGDIIRLHRVEIKEFQGRTQLVASIGGRKKLHDGRWTRPAVSSFILFDGSPAPNAPPDAPDKPYQVSSKTYHWDAFDKVVLDAQRRFVAGGTWRGASVNSAAAKYRRRINTAFDDKLEARCQFADLVGLVLATDTRRAPVVWVWDGSDAPAFAETFSSNLPQQSPQGGGPSTSAAAAAPQPPPPARKVFPFDTFAALPEAAAALPSVGTAIPVIFTDAQAKIPPAGTWVKLRNCSFQVVAGQLTGVMTMHSKWFAESHPDQAALDDYQTSLAENIVSAFAPADPALYASTTLHSDQPFTSLRTVKLQALVPDAQPGLYRCCVRVLACYPPLSEISAQCVAAEGVWEAAEAEGCLSGAEWVFAMQLRLEDGTGAQVGADVFAADGRRFLQNVVRPQDLRRDPGAREKLKAALEGVMRRDVWLDVCLKVYFPLAGNEGIAGRGPPRFRIFDTALKPPPQTQQTHVVPLRSPQRADADAVRAQQAMRFV